MPESSFASLAERLLRAGISPRHVRRLVLELETHYAMLVEEELQRGQPLAVAQVTAGSRLGTDAEIFSSALADPALRAWGARWPTLCGLMPVLALAGSFVATLALLAAVVSLLGSTHAPGPPPAPPWWLARGARWIGWLLMCGLPALWACVLARYAATRRLCWHWPLAGFILTGALGAATNVNLVWPASGGRGHLSAGVGFSTAAPALGVFAARGLVTIMLALAVFYLLRERQFAHRSH
jgi:hypothetical protein